LGTVFLNVFVPPAAQALEFLLDQPPASMNPRSTLDATGQRLNALLYSGLIRVDANLDVRPDLAESWETRNHGKEIHFRIRPGLKDHALQPITAESINTCLEQYRVGKPASPYSSSFPHWKGTRHTDREVILEFDQPDPYVFKNLSLLRYFRSESNPVPCSEPSHSGSAGSGSAGSRSGAAELIGSGIYKMAPWDPLPEGEAFFTPVDPRYTPVHFLFVPDDNTRVLQLLGGKIDATLDTLSLAKERWIQKKHPERFRMIERPSTRVGYVAFNLRDPILSKLPVRKAIALALDRDLIVQNKMFGFATLAGSFLAPELKESKAISFAFDPVQAEKLLDEAGYPRKGPDQMRFELHYKTTSVREGFENALMFREMLAKIGIRIQLKMVEPAVFLQSVRKRNFQIFASRWIGISDASILYRSLSSKSPDNRAGYSNPEMDQILEKAITELDPAKRIPLMQEVQEIAARDLPYFPLWFWNEGLLVRKNDPGLMKIQPEDLSLSGALEPILLMR
jgi:peptide/nickel transport system substrate-binding protein